MSAVRCAMYDVKWTWLTDPLTNRPNGETRYPASGSFGQLAKSITQRGIAATKGEFTAETQRKH